MTASKKGPPAPSYKIQVVGHQEEGWFRDQYHRYLRLSWPAAVGRIVALYFAVNAAFAAAYLVVGGVEGARAGSFFDAFSFSAQTLGTIGYGAMYPRSHAAQAVAIVESVAGLLATALATGLVFAKFSQPTGRIAFAHHAAIGPVDGVPTLMFRVGNERGNTIVAATVRVEVVRTVKTLEGVTFYRLEDLPLRRDRSSAMNRSWTVMHPIDASSPLRDATPESLARDEIEFLVTLVGTDDTSYQPVHARRSYEHSAVVGGPPRRRAQRNGRGRPRPRRAALPRPRAHRADRGLPLQMVGLGAAAGLTNGRRSRPIDPRRRHPNLVLPIAPVRAADDVRTGRLLRAGRRHPQRYGEARRRRGGRGRRADRRSGR